MRKLDYGGSHDADLLNDDKVREMEEKPTR